MIFITKDKGIEEGKVRRFLMTITILLVVGVALTACSAINQLFNPTPAPPPISENDTWAVKVLNIKKYNEPKEFTCTDCEPNDQKNGISLQDNKWFIDVKVQIINKTTEIQVVDEITIGLMLHIFTYGCGGVTVAGTDYCLPSGMIRDGKNYVNYNIDTDAFQQYLSFPPNAPDGEVVDFIFIVKSRGKYTDFYFDGLDPLYIKKVKAEVVTEE